MRKGNLLLCGIVAVAMLAPSCQAIAPDVEYKRLPDWNCLEGLESYTEENGAIVPVLHVGGNWKCNFANQWGELLVEGVLTISANSRRVWLWCVWVIHLGILTRLGQW